MPQQSHRLLSPLSADAKLEDVLQWLNDAVKGSVGRRGRIRYVSEAVNSDCSMNWTAYEDAGGGWESGRVTKARPLIQIDSAHTRYTRGDGGWIVKLPLPKEEASRVADEAFDGFLVWFRDEKTASDVAAGFQRAIKLCAQ